MTEVWVNVAEVDETCVAGVVPAAAVVAAAGVELGVAAGEEDAWVGVGVGVLLLFGEVV